jgi:hypothetical protein
VITLFVGDVTDDVRYQAQATDPTAQLITEENCKNLTASTYYVSLGDFTSLREFADTLDQADTLIYSPPNDMIWSDNSNANWLKTWTEFFLLYFHGKKKVINIHLIELPVDDIQAMTDLSDKRQTDKEQLWIAGCSITDGVGVTDDQRYGKLLANKLGQQVSFLTKSGSSIPWAADQILRSDIRKGDTVIWGLTSFDRLLYYKNKKLHGLTVNQYLENPDWEKVFPLDRLTDENNIRHNLCNIQCVINFCNKISADLYLFGILTGHENVKWLMHLENFYQLRGRWGQDIDELFLDLGTDNHHPGPVTNNWYAETMFNLISDAKSRRLASTKLD